MAKNKLKVLLIQDNAEYAALVRQYLEKEGNRFEVHTVLSLAEGRSALENGTFDAVLLELYLPDCQGLETFIRLRDHSPFTPIVILTSLDDEITALQAIQHGAQDYILSGQLYLRNFSGIIRCAIERHRMRNQLMNLSLRDELTSLYNRRGFFVLGEEQIKFAQRSKQSMLIILFDLDGLKSINDRFGHPEGDNALRSAAKILKKTFRKSDILARIGGDEFAVMALDAQRENYSPISRRFYSQLHALEESRSHPFAISISLGVSVFDPFQSSTLESCLYDADNSLYDAKNLKRAV